MARVGFVDIVEKQFKWPIGTWAKDKHFKELGYWYWFNLDVGLEGLLMALSTRGLGWSREEVLLLCSRARPQLRNPRIHAYMPM
jgi:hypothetical protein